MQPIISMGIKLLVSGKVAAVVSIRSNKIRFDYKSSLSSAEYFEMGACHWLYIAVNQRWIGLFP